MMINRFRRRGSGVAVVAGISFWVSPALGQSGGIDIPREEPPARRGSEPETTAPRSGLIDLRPRFEKGQRLRYKLDMRNSTGVEGERTGRPRRDAPDGGEGGAITRSEVEFGLLFRVVDVNEAREATVDIVMESIRFRIDGPDMTAEWDSTRPNEGDEIIAMILKSIVGTTMTATIDRTGNITRITGGEALSALGQVGVPAGAGSGGAGSLFGPIFSPRSGAGLVRIGESWENEDVIDSGLLGRFRMNTRHTLRRMEGRDAFVDVGGIYRTDSEGEGGGSPLVKIRESRYSGHYAWDTGAGALKELNTSMVTRAEQQHGEELRQLRSESAVKVRRVD